MNITGDIWKVGSRGIIVIPTNGGWNSKGENIMGRGLALQARDKFPTLPAEYGRYCRGYYGRWQRTAPVWKFPGGPVICFPTKPVMAASPQMSWSLPSSTFLIERSLRELVEIALRDPSNPYYVPLVGCGNGRLREASVLPLIEMAQGECPNLILVLPSKVPEDE